MDDENVPTFRPEELEQWLLETPKPLIIDVEPLRMCSEQINLLQDEITRIVEKIIGHIRAVLPAMPIGRHLRLVTLRDLPGSFAIQSQYTPWGRGAGKIYQSIRGCIAQKLTENSMPAETVPADILEPESPSDPHSLLSVDLVVEDDPDSRIVIAPEGTEMAEDGNYPEDALSIYEKSEFHVYGTKWKF